MYNPDGNVTNSARVSGSAAGFDRAQSVKNDAAGNIYLTGAVKGIYGDYDIKTVKLSPTGSYIWATTYDGGGDDIGNDVIVDASGNVYVCGESKGNDKDFFVIEYNSSGHEQWHNLIDCAMGVDIAYRLTFDSDSNLVVTGTGTNPNTYNQDFLTIAFKDGGGELWRDYYDGPDHGVDEAKNIISDNYGNLFVTGELDNNGEYSTVTIKYRTDFYINIHSVDTPSVRCLFYENSGQIRSDVDSSISDSVHYYTNYYSPQLFFGFGKMSMVYRRMDFDTSTADTAQRIDVSFLGSINLTKAFPLDENDSLNYLNYYKGVCPNGVMHVNGNGSLLFTDIYQGIDAKYSSNSKGLTLTFIVNPYSADPAEIGLKFQGQNSLYLVNNSELRVVTFNGMFDLARPKVYQIDANNNIVHLSWHLSWDIQNGNEARLVGWGTFNNSLPLFVDIRNTNQMNTSMPDNADWGTCLGASSADEIVDNCIDIYHNYYVCGRTFSSSFPGTTSTTIYAPSHVFSDAFVTKFNESQELIWSTIYGGSIPTNPNNNFHWQDDEIANGICTTKDSKVIFVGTTPDTDFPLPSSASGYFQTYEAGEPDGFIVELNSSDGTRSWATFFGGNTKDNIHAVIQPIGEDYFAIVGTTAGRTDDPDTQFPFPEVFLEEFRCGPNPTPSPIIGNGIALCNSSSGYFDNYPYTNYNPNPNYSPSFVRKGIIAFFDLSTKNLLHSTLYGGTGELFLQDIAYWNGHIAVLGRTSPSYTSVSCVAPGNGTSQNGYYPLCDIGGYFQTTSSSTRTDEFYSGVIGEFDGNFDLVWSTLFSSCDKISPNHLAFNSNGDLYIAGTIESSYNILGANCGSASNSCAFPLCQPNSNCYIRDHYDHTGNSNIQSGWEFFLTRFDSDRNIAWSTFVGGSGGEFLSGGVYNEEMNSDIAIDKDNKVYLYGVSNNVSSNSNGDIVLINPPGQGCYFDDINTSAAINHYDSYFGVFGEDNHLYWSSYIGGDGAEWGSAICYDYNSTTNDKHLYCAGNVQSSGANPIIIGSDLPSTTSWVQPPTNSSTDGFIWRFNLNNLTINRNDQEISNSVKCYPNPTSKALSFSMKGASKVIIKMYDILGNAILNVEQKSDDGVYTVDVSNLPPAMYFISILSKNQICSGKFIVER